MKNTKTDPHPNNPQRPHLRLLKPGLPSHENKNKNKTLLLFFAVTTLILSGLIYLASTHRTALEWSHTSLYSLQQVYQERGIAAFLDEKDKLRNKVAQMLNDSGQEDIKTQVEHIAVYLFPDLLPRENFEREQAMDTWESHQKAIEAVPGTDTSRASFLEMRANIWNYENPDKANPRLSTIAMDVIELYEELSR